MAWFLAPLYDRFVAPAEVASFSGWRADLLATLRGEVLDVGAGTGANIVHYPATVERVTFLEPDRLMRKRLEHKLAGHVADGSFRPAASRVVDRSADAIPFDDDSFDAVVATLVLCTVRDPQRVLSEIHRVLRPDGRLLFMEHVAATDRPDRLRWQERVDPLWHRVMGGCHLTRDTASSIEAAGFALDDLVVESARKATPLVRPTIRGTASPHRQSTPPR